MKPYLIDSSSIELDPRTVLLDTNVLYAYHSGGADHAAAVAYVETQYAVAVTDSVLAEAWGAIAGPKENLNSSRRKAAQKMMDWVADPTNGVVIVPDITDSLDIVASVCATHSIDLVDVLIVTLADRLSRQNEKLQPFCVASMDSGLYRLMSSRGRGYLFTIEDPRSPGRD